MYEKEYRMDRSITGDCFAGLCIAGMMDTKPVCCNFQKNGENTSYFEPYSIVSYGEVDVAYIGITTPSTITSSSPAQFKDENGNFLYDFRALDLYEVVQSNIDAAKAQGADYIIAISYVRYAGTALSHEKRLDSPKQACIFAMNIIS